MNQILYKCTIENNNNNNNNLKEHNYRHLSKIIFYICIILIIIAIFLYLYNRYTLFQKQKISKNLISNFNIKTLYSNSTDNYITEQLISQSYEESFVIGVIQIDKIDITYPILSTTSEELLKISPCRFYGPMPNEVGNLCIAGHNYIDDTQFGKVNNLNIDDIIKIFDLNGNFIQYKIYEKNEITANDFSCTNQNTNGLKEITLITCNNVKGNRLCIKAREI